jgi:hypothetical protein
VTIEEQVWNEVCKRGKYRPKTVAKKIPCSKDYVEKLSRKWWRAGVLERLEYRSSLYYKIKD